MDLLKLFNTQSYSGQEYKMINFILEELKNLPNLEVEVDYSGNIIVTKGVSEAFVCVMAHLDTVHRIIPDDEFKVVIKRGRLVPENNNVGVGGDDKCGIFACYELLRRVDNIKVMFFTGEEVGCTGSREVDMTHFDNVGSIIGIDRRGTSDIIMNNGWHNYSVSEEFKSQMEDTWNKYKYKEANGTITDAFTIQDRIEKLRGDKTISAINLSCGYHNPHTENEYVIISQLNRCIDMVAEMIPLLDGVVWEKEIEKYTPYYDNYTSRYSGYTGISRHSSKWLEDDDDDLPFNGQQIRISDVSIEDSYPVIYEGQPTNVSEIYVKNILVGYKIEIEGDMCKYYSEDFYNISSSKTSILEFLKSLGYTFYK